MIKEKIIKELTGKGFLTPRSMAYAYGCSKPAMYVFVRNNKELFEMKLEVKKSVFGDTNKQEKIKTYKVKENET